MKTKYSLSSLGWWVFFIGMTYGGVWDIVFTEIMSYISKYNFDWHSTVQSVLSPLYHTILVVIFINLTFKSSRAILSRGIHNDNNKIR